MSFTHLLITRPEAQANELAGQLADTGLEAVVLPAYGFEPESPGFDLARAWRPGRRRLAIFTSTRAVEFGLRQLPAGFLDGVEIAAIGPASAEALSRVGYDASVVPADGFDSESLLAHPGLTGAPGDALIFTAPGGRMKLRAGLEALDWKARVAFVYKRVARRPEPSRVAALRRATGIISVWTSASAMQILCDSLPEDVWDRVCRGACVVTSDRLGKQIERFGSTAVHLADGPGNAALRDCVLHLI